MITDLVYGVLAVIRQVKRAIKRLWKHAFCHHRYVLHKGPLTNCGMSKLIYYKCHRCGRTVWHRPPDDLICHNYYKEYHYNDNQYHNEENRNEI